MEQFTKDEKAFLKAAIKAGAVYTTYIRPIGAVGQQVIKEIKFTIKPTK